MANNSYKTIVDNNLPKVFLALDKLQESGLTLDQAAGIIGNLVIESRLDENAGEVGGVGYGLAQWTTKKRKQDLQNFVGSPGATKFEQQLEMMLQEMENPDIWSKRKYKRGFESSVIPRKTPAKDAAINFMIGYENPHKSKSHEKERVAIAEYLLSPEIQSRYKANLIPKEQIYLNAEEFFPGKLQGGGNVMKNYLYFFKSGGIHIKKKNRGKFTDYCGGKVTEECIQKGKHSSNPTTRKRAIFADNARHWHH